MTRRECYQRVVDRCSKFENTNESSSIAYLLMESLFGLSRDAIVLSPDQPLEWSEELEDALVRLASGEPVQYTLGMAHFYDREFMVSPNVLIPRPESEELVRMVLDSRVRGRVLDIGTGSGAIAISLALESAAIEVEACDISLDALEVARGNATRLGARVKMFHCDILSADIDSGYSAIVSNPPYVMESERAVMSPKVYDHEPNIALFVPDNDPLLFYRTIAQKGVRSLADGGELFFEINEAMGQQTLDMLLELGYRDVKVVADLSGRERMVRAIKG